MNPYGRWRTAIFYTTLLFVIVLLGIVGILLASAGTPSGVSRSSGDPAQLAKLARPALINARQP